jgi:hypothetical protein
LRPCRVSFSSRINARPSDTNNTKSMMGDIAAILKAVSPTDYP